MFEAIAASNETQHLSSNIKLSRVCQYKGFLTDAPHVFGCELRQKFSLIFSVILLIVYRWDNLILIFIWVVAKPSLPIIRP
jgi:hypothetical protein